MLFSILKPSLLASRWFGSSWAGAGASVGGFSAAFVGLRSKRDIAYISASGALQRRLSAAAAVTLRLAASGVVQRVEALR